MHAILFSLIIVVISVVFVVYRYTKKSHLRKSVESTPFHIPYGAGAYIDGVTNDLEDDQKKNKQHENELSDQENTRNSKHKGTKKVHGNKRRHEGRSSGDTERTASNQKLVGDIINTQDGSFRQFILIRLDEGKEE